MQLVIDKYEFIWDAMDWIKRKKDALIEKVKVEPIFNLQFMYPLWTNKKRLFHSGGSYLNHFQTIYISQHLFKHQTLVKQNNPTRKLLILSVSSIYRLLISRLDKEQSRRQTQRKPWGESLSGPQELVCTLCICVCIQVRGQLLVSFLRNCISCVMRQAFSSGSGICWLG